MHHTLMFISIVENSTKEDMEDGVRAMKGKNAMGCNLVDCKNWNHPKEKSQHDPFSSLHNSEKEDNVEVTILMCKLDTLFCI